MSDKLFAELKLPPELTQIAQERATVLNPANGKPFELAAKLHMCWPVGAELQVSFLDGLSEIHQRVVFYAQQWEAYANIRFAFDQDPDAQIRISFQEGFSESYIGISALYVAKNEATMNLCLMPFDSEEEYSRVVLHEFGHALGLIHEHQSPASSIQWNYEAVLSELTSPQFGWTKEDVQENIFERLAISQTQFYTGFDPESIMVYPIPARWTLNGLSIDSNIALSSTDKHYIGMLYPR